MGFLIRDLHKHIVELHQKQYIEHTHMKSFTVFRGQGLPKADFDRMMKTQGGLLSFNNFLSTTMDHQVSLAFAESNQSNPDLIGILFAITINPSISNTAFANVHEVSYFKVEKEILFSMHSIFRIGSMKQINGNNHLWQVDLTLTSDSDPDLYALTEQMRKETEGSTGWLRLVKLMIKLGQYKVAEDLCGILLAQKMNDDETGNVLFQLGLIKLRQEEHLEALTFYEKSLEIRQKHLSSQRPAVAECYNDIGLVYKKMGQYSNALSYYQKALKIRQETLPPDHSDIAESYNNIGSIYKKKLDNENALLYYNKALEIDQRTLPSNHPSLTTSYNNIGTVYSQMDDYSKALSYYNKALEIDQRTLPPNHPYLAISYNNIAWDYRRKGDYQQALTSYQQALDIKQHSLPLEHPSLQSLRESIEIPKFATANWY
ncbi:unnamed protein product [Rotaria sp. Silwood2]|nr:unnamed protein product [Rotaria sp. Silwood2]